MHCVSGVATKEMIFLAQLKYHRITGVEVSELVKYFHLLFENIERLITVTNHKVIYHLTTARDDGSIRTLFIQHQPIIIEKNKIL